MIGNNGTTDTIRHPNGESTVLVVDDEPHLVGLYAAMLEEGYVVETATSGEDAVDQITDAVDVVLLDRRMPGLSGDEVLEIIRDRGYDCRIAMVTSIEPDIDIVDMPFDAYLVKPVRKQDLNELVANLILRSQYSRGVQQSLAVTSKIAALESKFDADELDANEEYERLRERQNELEAANHQRITELMEHGDSGLVFRDVLRTIS